MMDTYEDISPNFRKALIEKSQDSHPFWKLIGMELIDVKKGWAKIRLPFSTKLTQADGLAHGGTIFASADAAVGMALLGMIERHETMVTVELKINYVKPFKQGEIIAEARIIHKGGRTAIGEVDIRDSEGDLVAKALSTFMIVKKSG